MRPCFCGWYDRCQSDNQTLAVIPSVHKTKGGAFCTIQLITDTDAVYTPFPYDDFQKSEAQIRIANNCFGPSGISLDTYTHVTTAAQKEAANTMGNVLNVQPQNLQGTANECGALSFDIRL